MNKLFFVFALLFTSFIYSQNALVKITDHKTGTTKVFQEKSRIRIKTVNGKKITGRFKILNDSTMLLKGKEISLSEIAKIKRNPLVMTVATNVVLLVAGGTITAIGVYSGGTAEGAILGTATLASMFLGPNILKGYSSRKYDIEFVEN